MVTVASARSDNDRATELDVLATLRAIARNTRPKAVNMVGLLTVFALWRVLAVAKFDYPIAAEIVSAMDPVAAVFGLAVAYRGLLLGALILIIFWPVGNMFPEEVDHPIVKLIIAGILGTILVVTWPDGLWDQAFWVPAIGLLWRYTWIRMKQLTESKDEERPTLGRVIGGSVLVALAASLAGPFQPIADDDHPWQPVEEVRYSRTAGAPVEVLVGALITHDQAALTYLRLDPRGIVWIRPDQIESRALCDRTGQECEGG